VRLGGLDQIVKMFDSKVTGKETVAGREAWRIESLPKPDYKPADEEEKRVLAVRRVVWLDDADGVLLKSLDIFVQPAGGLLPGSEVETRYAKLGDAWLCEAFIFRYKGSVYGRHIQGETRTRFYEYKKFEVESKIIE
jgi:hypothetical protein